MAVSVWDFENFGQLWVVHACRMRMYFNVVIE